MSANIESTNDHRWVAEHLFDLIDGALTDQDLERFNALLLADHHLRSYVVSALIDESLLADEVKCLQMMDEPRAAEATTSDGAARLAPTMEQNISCACGYESAGVRFHIGLVAFCALTAILLVSVGLNIFGFTPLVDDRGSLAHSTGGSDSDFIATVHGVTECRWASGASLLQSFPRSLVTGDSVQLLEGIAAIDLDVAETGRVRLYLEGPTGIVMTHEGLPSLTQGKVLVKTLSGAEDFMVETTAGRVYCSPKSEVGVLSLGSMTQIHVFVGSARLAFRWSNDDLDQPKSVPIEVNQALTLATNDDGVATIEEGATDPGAFAARVSMNERPLHITSRYVRSVKKANPIGYWRFEEERSGLIVNDMSDHYHLQSRGLVRRIGYGGNHVGVFNQSPQIMESPSGVGSRELTWTALVAQEPFQGKFQNGYAVEVWCKASHHHLSALVGFVSQEDLSKEKPDHGFLLELGAVAFCEYRPGERPGSVRFLHRTPSGGQGGQSCFSDVPYQSRRWYHLVAMKDRSVMKLYMNGELVAMAHDESTMDDGLRLIAGRLYAPPREISRPFIGQLDELAVYDRPLTEKEIRAHFNLGREDDSKSEKDKNSHYAFVQ